MKNLFQSLQSILFVFLIVIGMNAFTRPNGLDPIEYDIMEGKIAAASDQSSKSKEYREAQASYSQMKLQFEAMAKQYDVDGGDVQKLSMLSQVLYLYETELTKTRFTELTQPQQVTFLSRLNSMKIEFFSLIHKTK